MSPELQAALWIIGAAALGGGVGGSVLVLLMRRWYGHDDRR